MGWWHRTWVVACGLRFGRTSVWRVWYSVVVDGQRLNALVDKSLNSSQFISIVGQNVTPALRTADDDVDDDVSVDSCLRVVMTEVVSLLDFEYLSRIFTDAYRSLGSGTVSWLCGRPSRPHYASCAPVCLSVCLSVCPIRTGNSKRKNAWDRRSATGRTAANHVGTRRQHLSLSTRLRYSVSKRAFKVCEPSLKLLYFTASKVDKKLLIIFFRNLAEKLNDKPTDWDKNISWQR